MKLFLLRASIIFPAVLYSLISCNSELSREFIISHNSNILRFDKCYIIEYQDTLTENFVTLDSMVEMQFVGLTGFKLYDNKAYVGASMSVSDSTGEQLFKNEDLFIDYDTLGFDTLLVKERVGIFLVTSHPMKKNNTYKWDVRIYDKKGKGFIHSEAFITMK